MDNCLSNRSRIHKNFNPYGLLIKVVKEIVILEVFETELCFEIGIVSVNNLSVFNVMIKEFHGQERLYRRVKDSVFDSQKLVDL